MIAHTGLVVTDFVKSKRFYSNALTPIGLNLSAELPASVTGYADAAGFSESSGNALWISQGQSRAPLTHVAFRVEHRHQVDDFYAAAIEAGGLCREVPKARPYFFPNYYCASVLDPDGHYIEVFFYDEF